MPTPALWTLLRGPLQIFKYWRGVKMVQTAMLIHLGEVCHLYILLIDT